MTNTNETTTASITDETTDAASHASPAQTERVETPSAEARDASDPRVERTVEAAGRIVEAAVDIGRAWAAYGLRVGKLALETHAQTMGKLAGALGEIDRTIESRSDASPRASDASSPT